LSHWDGEDRLLLNDLSRSFCTRHPRLILSTLVIATLLCSNVAHAALLDVFAAELALARGMTDKGVALYRAQALQTADPAILERALSVALEDNDTDGGLAIAKHWVSVDPEYIPALFYMAHLSLKAHDYQLATQTLDKILRYDPNAALDRIVIGISPDDPKDRLALLAALQSLKDYNNPSLSVLKAGLLVQAGQPDQALVEVDNALRRKPGVTAFITLKVNILLSQNKLTEARQLLALEILRQPKNKGLQLFEVRLLLNNTQPQAAMKRLKTMTRRWPSDGEILLLAGLVSIDNKQMLDAERYLVQLLTIDQYVDQAYFYLAIAAERQNHITVAISYFRKVQGDELYRNAQKKLAIIMIANNRLDDELTNLTQERVEHPEQSAFLYLLQAQLLKDHGQPKLARKLLDEAIVGLPNQADLIYARILLLRPDETALLDSESEHLLSLNPDSPVYLNAFAFALAQQNRRLSDARTYAERANALAPNQAAIWDTLGFVALQQGDYKFALKTLKMAYSAEPSANIGLHLATALEKTNSTAELQQLIGELKQHFPTNPQIIARFEPPGLPAPAQENKPSASPDKVAPNMSPVAKTTVNPARPTSNALPTPSNKQHELIDYE
jgi:predicted Zn-dependent protease